MPLSLMHRQYILSARMTIFFLLLLLVTGVARAATFSVTTPGQQTLTNRFLPYAGSGTQLIGNSPAWRDSAGVLGINNYLEGLETLTPGAAVNLNFSTWRTKRITLNQNTVFTAINIPSVSTNVQTMLLEVIGDGAFTVSFANVTWQTPEITTPEAGVVTLYALRGDSGAVKGYTQAITATGIGPFTSGYIPVANATNNLTDSILFQVATNQLGFVTQDPFFTVDFALNSMGMGLHVLNEGLGIGVDNTGFGMASLYTIANGSFNSGFGFDALTSTLNGNSNSGLGQGALHDTTDGSRNIGLGARAGYTNTIGDSNIFIGYDANPVTNSDTNQIVIGTSTVGNGSNTTVIGNTNTVSAHILASGYAGAGTKFLSDDGTYKTAGGGGTAGTIINTGTPVVGNTWYATDTTGTNAAPSGALILGASTNVNVIGVLSGHSAVFTNTVSANGINLTGIESFGLACSDETTPLTTGTAKVTFRMPYAFTVTAVRASLTTAQASGNIFTVDINEAGVSILSTKLTIDNTETTSTTAVTTPVISDSALADDASMTIDIDQIGNGSATGLKVWIIGHQ